MQCGCGECRAFFPVRGLELCAWRRRGAVFRRETVRRARAVGPDCGAGGDSALSFGYGRSGAVQGNYTRNCGKR
jgi:hypothetical protein